MLKKLLAFWMLPKNRTFFGCQQEHLFSKLFFFLFQQHKKKTKKKEMWKGRRLRLHYAIGNCFLTMKVCSRFYIVYSKMCDVQALLECRNTLP